MSTPDFSVQVSTKAKHARLKLSARDGLVVVVPRGFDEKRIPGILDKKKEWIQKAEDRFAEQKKFLIPEPKGKLPERILLRVIGEEWSVDYRLTDSESVSAAERPNQRLLIFGDIDNEEACKEALKRWISRKSHEHLVPWLVRLASERGFELNRTLVKAQRTRWASCSKSKTITLNMRLMFLPEHLVRYVLLHELAHTKEMNHSRRFWAEVHALEPGFKELDAELRYAWRFIPAWLALVPPPAPPGWSGEA